MNFKYFILSILIFTLFGFYSFATEVENDTDVAEQITDDYSEITSKDEWYLDRVIEDYVFTGISETHEAEIKNIFKKYVGKKFNYELLSKLQNSLYSLSYIESIDPQVDITPSYKLKLIFEFKELATIEDIRFVSKKEDTPLKAKVSDLADKIGFSIGDYANASKIEYSVSKLLSFYKEIGYTDAEVDIDVTKSEDGKYNTIIYSIVEGVQKRVGEIVFLGNNKVSTRELKKHLVSKVMTTTKPGYFNTNNVEQDIKNLQSYYRNSGFVDANVSLDSVVDLDEDKNKLSQKVKIVYKVVEGEMWRVGNVTVFGNTVIDSKTLLSSVSLRKGNIFNNEKFENDKSQILNNYYNLGYVFATINASIKRRADNMIDIDYQIVEGVQAYIEKINFRGLNITQDYVFRRELAINDGDVFNRDKLQQSYQNIYNTGLVSELNYAITRGSDDEHLIMNFDIKEAQSMDLTFGVSFGGTEGGFPLSFVASFNNKNLAGTGKTLSVGTQVTTDYQSLNFSYGSSWFRDIRWSNSFSFSFERSVKDNILQRDPYSEYQVGRNMAFPYGYSSYDDYEAYDEAIPALKYLMSYQMYRFALGYNTGYSWIFNNKGRLSVLFGLSIGLNHVIYDENQYAPFEYLIYQYNKGWKFSNRASLTLTWDGRDYIDDTTKGYMFSENIVYAGGILQGLSNYIKSTTTASGYLALFKLKENDVKPRSLVASLTTSLSLVLPQFWDAGGIDKSNKGLGWHDAKFGATRSEMLYIDGMRNARGHSTVYDISFMWDSILELSFPIVKGVVNAEAFASMTAASKTFDNLNNSIVWYGAFGIGAKLKISGFPLGIYFTGDYKIKDNNLTWVEGGFFNYVHPVIAISTSLI